MLKDNDRQAYIEQIRGFPSRLETVVANLSDSQLDRSYGEGKWTVRQVVHHLADSHLNGLVRTKLALTENNPKLKPYDQDLWAALSDYEMPLDSSLALLRALHEKWCHLLDNMPEDAWGRGVDHPDPDYSNIEQLVIAYAGHGEKHLEHIKKVG